MGEPSPGRLDRYRKLRHFERTPEPEGGGEAAAVHTEDHPLSYLDLEGHIPEGEYGGGRMTVWDRGTYECEKWSRSDVMITLHGERAEGRYVLFRTGGTQWMLHRMDPPRDPGRRPMPAELRPVPLVASALPEDQEAWSFEAAWGGHRVMVCPKVGASGSTTSRTATSATATPSCATSGGPRRRGRGPRGGDRGPRRPGRPDPEVLRRRAEARSQAAVRRLADREPTAFLPADLVWLEGHPVTPLPYRQRRELLERLVLSGPAWRTAPSHRGEGAALLEAGRAQGLAGVVARRLEGAHAPGSLLFVPA